MKNPPHFRATATSDDYVRYQAGIRKYWRAILYWQGDEPQLSEQVFKTAAEALEFKRKYLGEQNEPVLQ